MPRVNTVKKCLKDQGECGKCSTPIVKGDPYVWWKFRYGGRHIRCTKSVCYPKPSDLTQSEFLSQMYDFQERIANIGENVENTTEDLAGERDMLVDEIRTLGEEQEEKKSNMPEGLQEGSTGELLEERYNNCEEWAGELENVDLDDLELSDDEKEEVKQEAKDGELDEEATKELLEEKKQEKIDTAVEELQACDYQGE